jgi:uncharacterized protein YdhG (YjbR/CyaY superfamily)
MRKMVHYKTVDDYIADAPKEAQAKLKQMRQAVKKAAPQATEKISYGIPYYNLNGRLLYFAGYKSHIGFYAMKTTIKAFEKELKGYQTSPGTVRFPLDKPLPVPLITKMVKFRVKENSQKAPKT